jgi:hypothetical protein
LEDVEATAPGMVDDRGTRPAADGAIRCDGANTDGAFRTDCFADGNFLTDCRFLAD